MGKTFHTKREYEKRLKVMGISAAKAAVSRHPGGTHAKGLRKLSPDKIHIAADRNRFGNAYDKAPACAACAAISNTLRVRRRNWNCGRPFDRVLRGAYIADSQGKPYNRVRIFTHTIFINMLIYSHLSATSNRRLEVGPCLPVMIIKSYLENVGKFSIFMYIYIHKLILIST